MITRFNLFQRRCSVRRRTLGGHSVCHRWFDADSFPLRHGRCRSPAIRLVPHCRTFYMISFSPSGWWTPDKWFSNWLDFCNGPFLAPVQRYSDGFHEATKAFLHLVKWFQPNGSLLLPWLRRIYTPHLSLMRWAFAFKDIALYLGSYMVYLVHLYIVAHFASLWPPSHMAAV